MDGLSTTKITDQNSVANTTSLAEKNTPVNMSENSEPSVNKRVLRADEVDLAVRLEDITKKAETGLVFYRTCYLGDKRFVVNQNVLIEYEGKLRVGNILKFYCRTAGNERVLVRWYFDDSDLEKPQQSVKHELFLTCYTSKLSARQIRRVVHLIVMNCRDEIPDHVPPDVYYVHRYYEHDKRALVDNAGQINYVKTMPLPMDDHQGSSINQAESGAEKVVQFSLPYTDKGQTYYKMCTVGNEKYKIGDCVLLAQRDDSSIRRIIRFSYDHEERPVALGQLIYFPSEVILVSEDRAKLHPQEVVVSNWKRILLVTSIQKRLTVINQNIFEPIKHGNRTCLYLKRYYDPFKNQISPLHEPLTRSDFSVVPAPLRPCPYHPVLTDIIRTGVETVYRKCTVGEESFSVGDFITLQAGSAAVRVMKLQYRDDHCPVMMVNKLYTVRCVPSNLRPLVRSSLLFSSVTYTDIQCSLFFEKIDVVFSRDKVHDSRFYLAGDFLDGDTKEIFSLENDPSKLLPQEIPVRGKNLAKPSEQTTLTAVPFPPPAPEVKKRKSSAPQQSRQKSNAVQDPPSSHGSSVGDTIRQTDQKRRKLEGPTTSTPSRRENTYKEARRALTQGSSSNSRNTTESPANSNQDKTPGTESHSPNDQKRRKVAESGSETEKTKHDDEPSGVDGKETIPDSDQHPKIKEYTSEESKAKTVTPGRTNIFQTLNKVGRSSSPKPGSPAAAKPSSPASLANPSSPAVPSPPVSLKKPSSPTGIPSPAPSTGSTATIASIDGTVATEKSTTVITTADTTPTSTPTSTTDNCISISTAAALTSNNTSTLPSTDAAVSVPVVLDSSMVQVVIGGAEEEEGEGGAGGGGGAFVPTIITSPTVGHNEAVPVSVCHDSDGTITITTGNSEEVPDIRMEEPYQKEGKTLYRKCSLGAEGTVTEGDFVYVRCGGDNGEDTWRVARVIELFRGGEGGEEDQRRSTTPTSGPSARVLWFYLPEEMVATRKERSTMHSAEIFGSACFDVVEICTFEGKAQVEFVQRGQGIPKQPPEHTLYCKRFYDPYKHTIKPLQRPLSKTDLSIFPEPKDQYSSRKSKGPADASFDTKLEPGEPSPVPKRMAKSVAASKIYSPRSSRSRAPIAPLDETVSAEDTEQATMLKEEVREQHPDSISPEPTAEVVVSPDTLEVAVKSAEIVPKATEDISKPAGVDPKVPDATLPNIMDDFPKAHEVTIPAKVVEATKPVEVHLGQTSTTSITAETVAISLGDVVTPHRAPEATVTEAIQQTVADGKTDSSQTTAAVDLIKS